MSLLGSNFLPAKYNFRIQYYCLLNRKGVCFTYYCQTFKIFLMCYNSKQIYSTSQHLNI